MGRTSQYALPYTFHLRLLHALANDAVCCDAARSEVANRLESLEKLQVHKYHSDAEVRGAPAGGGSGEMHGIWDHRRVVQDACSFWSEVLLSYLVRCGHASAVPQA